MPCSRWCARRTETSDTTRSSPIRRIRDSTDMPHEILRFSERGHTNRPRQQRLDLGSGVEQLSCKFVGFPFLSPVPWEWVGMEQQVAHFVRACEAIPIDRGGALVTRNAAGHRFGGIRCTAQLGLRTEGLSQISHRLWDGTGLWPIRVPIRRCRRRLKCHVSRRPPPVIRSAVVFHAGWRPALPALVSAASAGSGTRLCRSSAALPVSLDTSWRVHGPLFRSKSRPKPTHLPVIRCPVGSSSSWMAPW